MFSCFFHGQMLFHAKALELYTAAFQNVFSMDEEQDIEVCNFSANLAGTSLKIYFKDPRGLQAFLWRTIK